MDESIHWPTIYLFLSATVWWNFIMDDWNLNEKPLGKWQYLQHYKFIICQENYKEWQIMLGLTFSVGDTTLQFKISIEQMPTPPPFYFRGKTSSTIL